MATAEGAQDRSSPPEWDQEKTRTKILESQSDMVALTDSFHKQQLSVHKELLCFYSPYFKVALQGNFKEAQEGVGPMASPEATLRMFSGWLYTGVITLRGDGNDFDRTGAITLFILADKHNVEALRIAIVRAFLSSSDQSEEHLPPIKAIKFAFDRLPESSLLCKLLVRLYINHFDADYHDKKDIETLPSSFLAQVLVGHSSNWWSGRRNTRKCDCCDKKRAEWIKQALETGN